MSKKKRVLSLGQTGKEETIYVELDCILDTRLATVARLNESVATTLLNGDYYTRAQDKFEGIDMAAYKELYANRDGETLRRSMHTDILPLISHLAGTLREQAIKRPYHDGGAFVVNYWPYNLAPEVIEAIRRALTVRVAGMGSVYMRSIRPKDLTPKYCKQHYSMMVMYDYGTWLDLHAKAFEKVRIPEISMLAPAIYFKDELPSEKDMAQFKAEGMHPLKAVEMTVASFIELTLIDIKFFSVFNAAAATTTVVKPGDPEPPSEV